MLHFAFGFILYTIFKCSLYTLDTSPVLEMIYKWSEPGQELSLFFILLTEIYRAKSLVKLTHCELFYYID